MIFDLQSNFIWDCLLLTGIEISPKFCGTSETEKLCITMQGYARYHI